MERTIGTLEARRMLGKVLQEVTRGDKYIVERNGEPIAAVVPIELYNQWRREREAFFEKLQEVQERSGLSPEEADQLAAEAVQAVRQARRV